MPEILHLGHQPADIGVDPSWMLTTATYFDPAYDTNAVIRTLTSAAKLCFYVAIRSSEDFFFSFRHRRNTGTFTTNLGIYDFIAYLNDKGDVVGGIELYHTAANQGFRTRPFVVTAGGRVYGTVNDQSPSNMTAWFDSRYSYNSGTNQLTVEFYVNGVLISSVTDTPLASYDKGIIGIQTQIPGSFSGADNTIGIAHVAVVEGASTVNRRFIRRLPSAAGTFTEWTGDVTTLGDGVSAIMTNDSGDRVSFAAGTGPAIPGGASIAGIHVGIRGEPSQDIGVVRPFVRIGGLNYFNGALTFENNKITKQVLTFDLNPATSAIWTGEPDEYGVNSGA